MTWKPHYYADVNGRVRKISEMTLSQVSSAIQNIYAEFKTRDKQLHALHERLWHLRKSKNPNVQLTNTRMKILENFKLKKTQTPFVEIQNENERLKTILGLALENISNENILMVENILKNAFVGDEEDD
jgi:DNA-directed RNA polymerase delta subunit